MAVLKIRPAASYRCNEIVTGGHDAVTGSQEAPRRPHVGGPCPMITALHAVSIRVD
jgi:hypothetical protein